MLEICGYGLFGGLGIGLGVILWIVIIALGVWAIMVFLDNGRQQSEETPPEILKRRYARGEISGAEYEMAKRNLD